MTRPCYFIGSEIFRPLRHGSRHPLNIPRVSTTIDLCRELNWLDLPGSYLDSPCATPDELHAFHDPAYIAALVQAEETGVLPPELSLRFNLGGIENPIYSECFTRPATAAGGTLLAAELLAAPGIVYHPAGGTHHGRVDRASGFCYLNDPVLGICRFLANGFSRVLYVDLDAHHPDGVEDRFAGDQRVRMISVHEARRWPFTGRKEDRAGGSAWNFPVPRGFNDSELGYLMSEAILPLAQDFEPEIVFIQGGADGLLEDPLSRLALSNRALWETVAVLADLAPRTLVVGGGGYNPWSVGRCWAGIWATLSGSAVPERLPEGAERRLRAISWSHRLAKDPPEAWFTTLMDPPRPGHVRDEVKMLAGPVAA